MQVLQINREQEHAAPVWANVCMRLALAFWIALALAHAVKTIADPHAHSVFPIFHEAGQFWRDGRSIYHHAEGTPNEFFYSPAFAVLLAPLSFFSLPAAAVMWSWLSLGLLFVALRSLYKEVIDKWQPTLWEGPFLLLAGVTAVQGGWSAQSNSLVLAGVLFGITSLMRGRYWRAAFCLAIPVHIKVWPIIAVALLSVRYFRELSWRAAVAIVAVGAIPFLTASPLRVVESYTTWVEKLEYRQEFGSRYGGYRDTWTILENTMGEPSKTNYKIWQAVAGLTILAWTIRNAQKFTKERWLLATLAWWGVWQLLCGPGTERLTYGILAPCGALAVLESQRLGRLRFWAVTAWLFTGILGTGEFERIFLRFWSGAEIMTPLGVIGLAIWQFSYDLLPTARLQSNVEPTEISGQTHKIQHLPQAA
jgi:Glycosyltransferase family 87